MESNKLFSTLNRADLADRIIFEIKKMISERRLLPGQKLPTERELTEQFGVSRASVREALHSLETQRHAAELYALLKKQLPNVKYVVRHYDVSLKECPAPMINEAAWAKFKTLLEEACEVRYEKLRDVDNATYRATLDKLVEKGLLKGKGGEGEDLILDLAEDNVRMLVILDRTGVFGD